MGNQGALTLAPAVEPRLLRSSAQRPVSRLAINRSVESFPSAASTLKERDKMSIEESSVHDRASNWLRAWMCLAANAAMILLVTAGAASAQSVSFA
jgi:hypothetical protein